MLSRITGRRRNSRKNAGELIVFEGPDESGKTTISKLLAEEILGRGKKCIWLGFPGHKPGTLGAEVYALHHDTRFAKAPALSVQLLHVAAHIEAIELQILPALAEGTWIVLDRYWWSTWGYGLASGAHREDLQLALDIERRHWGRVLPAIAFLFMRNFPDVKNQPPQRVALQKLYVRLAGRERRRHPVEIVHNNHEIEDTLRRIVATISSYCPDHR